MASDSDGRNSDDGNVYGWRAADCFAGDFSSSSSSSSDNGHKQKGRRE